MQRLLLLLPFLLLSWLIMAQAPASPRAAMDDHPDMERFIDSLMAEMTLEEMIGQTVQYTSGWDVTGPALNTDYERWIREGKVGSLLNAHGAAYTRNMQRIAVEETRLGIPLVLGYDVIHGFRTIFPINLGSAASWDIERIEQSARIAAEEASAAGLHWTFSPMIDLAQDPRWGRISEGSGEDVYLSSRIAEAYVRGYQGEDIEATNTIMACAKHFVGYGAAQAGRDYHTVDMSLRELATNYLPPFKAAVDAGVWTFMTAFNELNGIPATGNAFLFRDILREEWGFEGFVVSDYTAINEMVPHGYAADGADAARLAMQAGVDMDMMGSLYRMHLGDLVDEDRVDRRHVEAACRRILEAKYALGLFHDPYRYSDEEREESTILREDFLDAARELAAHSMVLLKNDDQVLPLRDDQRVALIGPLADDDYHIIGSWAASGDRQGSAVSVREALDNRLGSDAFTYAQGTEIDTDEESGFAAAVEAAANSDVALMVMGEAFDMSGEAASRTDITLPGNQRALIEAVLETGTPVVLVLMNGRPLALQWEHDHVSAILEAWFPGTMGGAAIVDVLYGDHNPSGKLPVTFPRNLGQVPIFYNVKNTGRPRNDAEESKYRSKYIDAPNTPLYPFGHGLSYTTFTYGEPSLSDPTLSADAPLTVRVDVTNSGDHAGHEVVQLYIRDLVGSVTRPVRELKAFEKIYLEPGQSTTVTLELSVDDLRFYDQNMEYVYEPGAFDLFVGGSSNTDRQAGFTLVE